VAWKNGGFYERRKLEQGTEISARIEASFLSACDPTAGAWRHASTKLEENLLSDQAISDASNKLLGLDLDLPDVCAACGITIPVPREGHGVSCAASKGGSGRAGGHLERAVIYALQVLQVDLLKKPVIDNIPGFERLNREEDAKTYGDALVETGGASYVIDVTFSTDPFKRSVESKEKAKYAEYSKNRRTPHRIRHFLIPMAVDMMGKWGSLMKQFFDRIVERRQRLMPPQFKKEIARAYRFGKERISLATVKAYGAYMKIIRYGWKKKKGHVEIANAMNNEIEDNESSGSQESDGDIEPDSDTTESTVPLLIP
jgi:hypothetical protein